MSGSEGRVTLWMIEIFAAIAEDLSISTAARRIGTSPSTVSQQLSKLEAIVNVPLVDRAARPLRLTPQGEIFRRRALSILDEAALARAELADRGLASLARFRLGMIEDFDADVTPRLLGEMGDVLRDCQFLLETGPSHRLLSQLEDRALDMVVAADTAAAADWMEVHPLLEEPFVAAVPLRDGRPAAETLAELARRPLIQYTQRHHMGRQIAAHLTRQNLVLAHRYEMDSYHAILAMVAEGAGWTILTPLGLLRAQRFLGRVAVVSLPGAPLSRQIALWSRRGALGTMPADIARRLRGILGDLIVAPARARMPWLEATLRILPEAPVYVP
ncbi:MAG: LysR family transcriptional regulator [Rhodobacteraceae bacterium]|nr:LysR family transcriptional regulator [Paracoccaceae bacterium]